MVASPGSSWVVVSSLFFAGYIAVLLYKGYLVRYQTQICMALLLIWFSCMHHVCAQPDIDFCAGADPAVSNTLDSFTAFLNLVCFLSIFVDCWMGGAKWASIYQFVMFFITAMSYSFWQDNTPSLIFLGLCAAIVFSVVLFVEFRVLVEENNKAKQTKWFVCFGAVVLCALFTAVCYGVEYKYSYGTDTWADWHAGFHMCLGLTGFFSALLLPDAATRELHEKDHAIAVQRAMHNTKETVSNKIDEMKRQANAAMEAFKKQRAAKDNKGNFTEVAIHQ